MTNNLWRAGAAFLAGCAVMALLAGSHIGWMLVLIGGGWVLVRPPGRAGSGRHLPRAVSPVQQEPYWLMPAIAGAGAAALLHQRDQEVSPDTDDVQDEIDFCAAAYEEAPGEAESSWGWDAVNDADLASDFGGYGGGGSWGGDFGGDGGGGDWGDDDDGW